MSYTEKHKYTEAGFVVGKKWPYVLDTDVGGCLKLRVFVAVEVNDVSVLEEIGRLQSAMPDVKKFVELHNLHFTLSFLGEVSTDLVERISDKLSRISFKSFDVQLHGIGSFGGRRIIWVGSDDKGGKNLKELASKVNAALAGCGLEDGKSFRPHLTILRVRRGDIGSMLQRFSNKSWGVQHVGAFKLKQSVLGRGGPTYTDIIKVGAK